MWEETPAEAAKRKSLFLVELVYRYSCEVKKFEATYFSGSKVSIAERRASQTVSTLNFPNPDAAAVPAVDWHVAFSGRRYIVLVVSSSLSNDSHHDQM